MKWQLGTRAIALLLSLSGVAISFSAQAALGGGRETVLIDHKALATESVTVSNLPLYQVHELKHANGALVREYVSPAGTVFAIHWEGKMAPNLSQLLGQHYADYLQALSAERHSHHMVQIKQGGLVVTHVQYLRSFTGSAYVPALVPTNVDPSQLN